MRLSDPFISDLANNFWLDYRRPRAMHVQLLHFKSNTGPTHVAGLEHVEVYERRVLQRRLIRRCLMNRDRVVVGISGMNVSGDIGPTSRRDLTEETGKLSSLILGGGVHLAAHDPK